MKESLKNYRNQLAEDIKNEPDPEKRKAILASEKNTIRYKDSEEEHREESLDKVVKNREIKNEEGDIIEEMEKLEGEKREIQDKINKLKKEEDEFSRKIWEQRDLLNDINFKRNCKNNPNEKFKELLDNLDYSLTQIGYGSGGSMGRDAIRGYLRKADLFLDVCGDNESLDIQMIKDKIKEVEKKLPSYYPS